MKIRLIKEQCLFQKKLTKNMKKTVLYALLNFKIRKIFSKWKSLSYLNKNEEVNYNQDNLQEVSDSALNSSVLRSGLIRQTKSINSMGRQVGFCHIDQPTLRKVELFIEEIKTALAKVSVRLQISPQKSHKAAHAFSKKFYGHNFYLLYKEK